MIDWNRFRLRAEVGKLRDQAGPRTAGFTHAHNTAAAHIYSGVTDFLQRFQTVLISARSDKFAIKLGRCIEVMVVIIKPGLPQLLSLTRLQHPQCRARFESEALY